jgi:hypothetical protein
MALTAMKKQSRLGRHRIGQKEEDAYKLGDIRRCEGSKVCRYVKEDQARQKSTRALK